MLRRRQTLLESRLLDTADTLIVLSYDSLRTRQEASASEIGAVRGFLAHPITWSLCVRITTSAMFLTLPHDQRVELQAARFFITVTG